MDLMGKPASGVARTRRTGQSTLPKKVRNLAGESSLHSATVTSMGAVSAKVPHATLRVTLWISSLG